MIYYRDKKLTENAQQGTDLHHPFFEILKYLRVPTYSSTNRSESGVYSCHRPFHITTEKLTGRTVATEYCHDVIMMYNSVVSLDVPACTIHGSKSPMTLASR